MDMYYNNSIKTAMGIRHTLHFIFINSIEYIKTRMTTNMSSEAIWNYKKNIWKTEVKKERAKNGEKLRSLTTNLKYCYIFISFLA